MVTSFIDVGEALPEYIHFFVLAMEFNLFFAGTRMMQFMDAMDMTTMAIDCVSSSPGAAGGREEGVTVVPG